MSIDSVLVQMKKMNPTGPQLDELGCDEDPGRPSGTIDFVFKDIEDPRVCLSNFTDVNFVGFIP